jgi:hypothetical protein
MRSKVCEDGKNRILAKVVVPMGTHEIALFAMSNPRFCPNDEALNDFENLNKRQIFNVAKETVALRGVDLEAAGDVVRVHWTPRQMERAAQHVKQLFPEVD